MTRSSRAAGHLAARPKARRSSDRPQPAVPVAAPLQPPPRTSRVALAFLWLVLLGAAVIFIYPLWPAAVYQWHKLHPQPLPNLTVHSYTGSQTNAHTAAASAAANQIPITDNRLIIPAIGVDTPIVEGSNLKVLDKTEGVWHQTGNLNKGNLVLAGHRFRYLPPNTSTLYDLNQLKPGDLVAVDWLGRRTVYKVNQVITVPATDIALLNPTPHPQLTVYSCSDVLQTHRIAAIATPLPNP